MVAMFILKTLFSTAVLWHVFAFASGGVYVFHAYRVLFFGGHNPAGLKVIRTADVHLWLSGFTVIGLGIAMSGLGAYFSNPKTIGKVSVGRYLVILNTVDSSLCSKEDS